MASRRIPSVYHSSDAPCGCPVLVPLQIRTNGPGRDTHKRRRYLRSPAPALYNGCVVDHCCKARFFIFGRIGVLLRNRTLLAVSFAVCATFTGIGMVVPVRTLYARSHGASLFIIGAMASSYLISNFLFQYPSGWLADRWGRKPIMMLSLFLQAAVTVTQSTITDLIYCVVGA